VALVPVVAHKTCRFCDTVAPVSPVRVLLAEICRVLQQVVAGVAVPVVLAHNQLLVLGFRLALRALRLLGLLVAPEIAMLLVRPTLERVVAVALVQAWVLAVLELWF
jgi:hypothetical protein